MTKEYDINTLPIKAVPPSTEDINKLVGKIHHEIQERGIQDHPAYDLSKCYFPCVSKDVVYLPKDFITISPEFKHALRELFQSLTRYFKVQQTAKRSEVKKPKAIYPFAETNDKHNAKRNSYVPGSKYRKTSKRKKK